MVYYERPPEASPLEHVQALTEHLNAMATRVRELVTDAIGDTVAKIANDATKRVMGMGLLAKQPSAYDRGQLVSSDQAKPSMDIDRAIMAGIAIAAWMIRKGRPMTAIGLGSLAAAAIMSGSRSDRTRSSFAATLAELISLAAPLTRGASRFMGS